jgi:hypothetical protein
MYDIKQREVHTAERLVPVPVFLRFKLLLHSWKEYKSPGCDQTPAELTHAGDGTILSAINKLINFI